MSSHSSSSAYDNKRSAPSSVQHQSAPNTKKSRTRKNPHKEWAHTQMDNQWNQGGDDSMAFDFDEQDAGATKATSGLELKANQPEPFDYDKAEKDIAGEAVDIISAWVKTKNDTAKYGDIFTRFMAVGTKGRSIVWLHLPTNTKYTDCPVITAVGQMAETAHVGGNLRLSRFEKYNPRKELYPAKDFESARQKFKLSPRACSGSPQWGSENAAMSVWLDWLREQTLRVLAMRFSDKQDRYTRYIRNYFPFELLDQEDRAGLLDVVDRIATETNLFTASMKNALAGANNGWHGATFTRYQFSKNEMGKVKMPEEGGSDVCIAIAEGNLVYTPLPLYKFQSDAPPVLTRLFGADAAQLLGADAAQLLAAEAAQLPKFKLEDKMLEQGDVATFWVEIRMPFLSKRKDAQSVSMTLGVQRAALMPQDRVEWVSPVICLD